MNFNPLYSCIPVLLYSSPMRRSLLLLCWLATDLVLFIGAYVAAYFLRVGFILSTDFPLQPYVQTTLLIAPIWIAILAELGVYKLIRIQSDKRNLLYILFACVMGTALFTLAYYFIFEGFFSRLLLVYAGALSFLFAVLWHLAFDQWQRRLLRKNPPAFPVLVIGTNREAERFVGLLEEKQSPLKPVAVLDPQGSQKNDLVGVPVLGKLNKLEETIASVKPKFVVQCSNLEHTINLISVCRNHGITYMLLPSVLGIVERDERIESLEGKAVTVVSPDSSLWSWFFR